MAEAKGNAVRLEDFIQGLIDDGTFTEMELNDARLRMLKAWYDNSQKRVSELVLIIKDAGLHKTAPCCLCGYNGPNYHQPEFHKCMEQLK